MKRLRRRELYEAVWDRPVSVLAREWEVSDTWIKKTCKYHNVPVPARGFWQRKSAGQTVPTTPLPEGGDVCIILGKEASRKSRDKSLPPVGLIAEDRTQQCSTKVKSAPSQERAKDNHQLQLSESLVLLERDANEALLTDAMQLLLTKLAARLAHEEIDPRWRGWILAIRSAVDQRPHLEHTYRWAMQTFHV